MAEGGLPLPAHQDADQPVILHIVSYDVSRGAERYARALVDELNRGDGERHLLMTMFVGDEDGLGADLALGVPRGVFRRIGLDPRVVKRMRDVFRTHHPQAIVAHGGEPAKYAALASGGDVPFVYLVIGSSHPLLDNPLRRRMRDFYVRRAAAVVAVSTAIADEMRALGVPDTALHVIPNGRDPEIYELARQTRRETQRVLFVGHLDEQKRPLLFVSLISELRRRGLDATGVMVGGGPLHDEVASQAQSSGIEVLGPRDDVPALLSGADLFVLTSRPPEGMPGVLIEAGMAGVAAVTTDVPGARDVVIDGVTGRVVGVDDESGLTEAVEGLLRDDGLRATMGMAARERCVAEFSLEASAGDWIAVLQGISS
jgi:glycosyltransferase involved in cell wall biosynthesis